MMTTKRIELWECENCGERAINGNGRARTARDDERFHACERLTVSVAKRAARVTMHNTEAALAALLVGVRRWAADEDGVPYEMWPAYVAACDALGLPRPEAKQ